MTRSTLHLLRHNRWLRAFLVCLAALTLAGSFIAGGRASQGGSPEPSDAPPGDGPWVLVAYYQQRPQLEALASRLEPLEVDPQNKRLVVIAWRQDYLWMQQMGFVLQVDEDLTLQLLAPRTLTPQAEAGIPNFACYRTVEETYARAASLAAQYPALASWLDIGDSWERTASPGSGDDLRVLRLTNSAIPGPKPALLVMSALHAREYAPAELNTRFAEYLLSRYNQDPDVTWMLDHQEFHLLLQANPDGRKRAETGYLWRKNTNANYCNDMPFKNYGADLNRNFSFQWGLAGSSHDECSEVYRGLNPASEPETQAFESYIDALYPDLRQPDLSASAPLTTSGVFIDLHSYSELVLWPWGFTTNPPPNSLALQTLGRRLAFFNGYTPQQADQLYPTSGTSDDYIYGELGVPAYVIEMGDSFFQDCASFVSTILPDNLDALIYAARVTRAPYILPAGPEAISPQLSSAYVEPGETVTLTVALDDGRFIQSNGVEATQPISTALYTIDIPPWQSGAGAASHPLSPTDGAFDEVVEPASAIIDTALLPYGRRLVFIHAQDTTGTWGPVSAAFLTILPPNKFYLPLVRR